ncbi:hypothetical protein P3T76_006343 [Phytophthora citrophthora]|uniref:Uncharacterized protein n=1 Tax=Phytophthora citrophthora TaxID=4793 RepID=A0AAD9LN31_9STRA|nr:hypothetical protein P3T76_006343 [Phytophthora citrophthora]
MEMLSSSNIFSKSGSGDSLYATKSDEFIRLYVSLREERNETETPAQSVVVTRLRTRSQDDTPAEFDGALCVRGMFASSTDQENDERIQRWPFLSKGLVELLREIANTAWWWDGQDKVEYDLKGRREYEKEAEETRLSSVLPDDVALKWALNTLEFPT